MSPDILRGKGNSVAGQPQAEKVQKTFAKHKGELVCSNRARKEHEQRTSPTWTCLPKRNRVPTSPCFLDEAMYSNMSLHPWTAGRCSLEPRKDGRTWRFFAKVSNSLKGLVTPCVILSYSKSGLLCSFCLLMLYRSCSIFYKYPT